MKKAYQTALYIVVASLALAAAVMACLHMKAVPASNSQPENLEYYVGYSRGGPDTNEPIYQISVEALSHYTYAPSQLDREQIVLYQATQYTLQHKGRYLLLDSRLIQITAEKQREVFRLCQESYDIVAVEYKEFSLQSQNVDGVVLHFIFRNEKFVNNTVDFV